MRPDSLSLRASAVAFTALALLCALTACGDSDTVKLEDYGTRDVTLPGGELIHAEVASTQPQVQKGLMFRTSLAPDRGMLFLFSKEDSLQFWMFQTLIPLDIVWMDASRCIVEISPDTPPCKTKASLCADYGGHQTAQFVLELGGGEARRLGLTVGQTLEF